MNPVIHFEMPAEDRERMAEFYKKTFGWQVELLGPEMNEYSLVTTTENGENGMPKTPGQINGGFYKRSKDFPVQHTTVVIAVEDINASIEKVKEADGKVLGKPDEIPGVGMFVYFEDTEGNVAGILQPVPMDEG
ncbi:VOC family protein [Aliifodinibius sp. S!AR15-10]|uniref:VOC family protein n=1 Tax=Aliifodinibius sp. S!AR15-10 TaxID=2950437 RepID=UPI002857B2F0|nr:VOC family protein [Aliifodinibius sp. S!AR15-10]MDR8393735.1 VOC family protein [Aliifodinibius sp. S!AR15-10]